MKSLSIEKESYGSLHIPILASKFTTDLRAKFTDNIWLLDQLLVILKNELEAKERFDNPGDKQRVNVLSTGALLLLFTLVKNLLKATVLFVVARI